MKQRRVSFTLTAQQHVDREKAWWLENRDHAQVFTEELEQALNIVSLIPAAGTFYTASPVPGDRAEAARASTASDGRLMS